MYVRLIFVFFFFSLFDFRNWRPCCVPIKQRAKERGNGILCSVFSISCFVSNVSRFSVFYFILFYFHGEGLV